MGKRRDIPAGEFKARCLAILDDVAETGEEVVVTKRGKPIARVVPLEPPRSLKGSVVREDDLITPIEDDWDAQR